MILLSACLLNPPILLLIYSSHWQILSNSSKFIQINLKKETNGWPTYLPSHLLQPSQVLPKLNTANSELPPMAARCVNAQRAMRTMLAMEPKITTWNSRRANIMTGQLTGQPTHNCLVASNRGWMLKIIAGQPTPALIYNYLARK